MINCMFVLLVALSAEAMYSSGNPNQPGLWSSASIFSSTSLTNSEMKKIISNDWSSDFRRTNAGLREFESFFRALNSGMESSSRASGIVLGEAARQRHFRADSRVDSVIRGDIEAATSIEGKLGYVLNTWKSFRSTIEKIKSRKLHQGEPETFSAKCKEFGWVQELKQISAGYSIYTEIVNIFYEELYMHCYKMKMAQFDLKNIAVPKRVQEFVNIYLGMSPQWASDGFLGTSPLMYCEKLESDSHNFDLYQSLLKYGYLERVAKQLILSNPERQVSHPTTMVAEFRHYCINHIVDTQLIIASLDELVVLMERQHLAGIYARNKAGTPMLVYATICRELATAPN